MDQFYPQSVLLYTRFIKKFHLPKLQLVFLSTEDFRVVVAEWVSSMIPQVKKRDLELPLNPSNIISVLGPRRAGKTSILYGTISRLLAKGVPRSNILYIDFEHPKLPILKASDLDNMLVAFYELSKPDNSIPLYLFLDEIQNVQDYGRWFRRRLNAKFFVSGSTFRLSSRNVAEELRGRSVDYVVYPLSFREYLNFKAVHASFDRPEMILYSEEMRGTILSALRDYLRFGGYPEVALLKEQSEKVRLLRSYFNSVVVRDFAFLEPSLAEPLAKFIIQNYAGYFSINRIYAYLKSLGHSLGKERVLRLIDAGLESFFFFPLELFAKSERKRQINLKKLYIVDTGYHAALGYEFSIGRSMENAVMLELKRREKEVYYWKEYGKSEGREVDFVVSKNFSAEELIQVTYSSDGIRSREIEALKKAGEEMGARTMKLITWDEHGELEGVKLVPLWYWLLQRKS
jgi:predicted AAA+ superfamily ATPase